MTQVEKDTEVKKLQAAAKDYQAELGFLMLQIDVAETRIETLKVLMSEGERQFQVLQQTKVTEVVTPGVSEDANA